VLNIETITISEWTQLFDLEPEGGGWVYRGQADANWDLESSLRRTIARNRIRYGFDEADVLYSERASLKSFSARAHFYLRDLPPKEDLVAWLTVMQHHGAPTRLLDFTRSIYVAVFFALMEAVGDSCVWAFNDNWLRGEGSKFAVKNGHDHTDGLRFGELKSSYQAANWVLGHNRFGGEEEDFEHPAVLMVDPDRQIPRLAIQQGLFLFPTSLGVSFMDNLAQLHPCSYSIPKKLILKYELRDQALMHLRSMNVTAESLFPGIDGFARSLIQTDMQ
jgi:hypothetical protein